MALTGAPVDDLIILHLGPEAGFTELFFSRALRVSQTLIPPTRSRCGSLGSSTTGPSKSPRSFWASGMENGYGFQIHWVWVGSQNSPSICSAVVPPSELRNTRP